tara:strand:- start:330 stop:521 length:192 start_codon:yes stop_codon:yes gene_type:complete
MEIVAKTLECTKVNLNDNFKMDLNADDLDVCELMGVIEKKFSVEIGQKPSTVIELVNFLLKEV